MDVDDFATIASLSVHHLRRVDDAMELWDEYAVTVELRAFVIHITQLEEGGYGAYVTETTGRRGEQRREHPRATVESGSWHAAYAAALGAIITGVATGEWSASSVPLPISLPDTPQWQQHNQRRREQNEEHDP